MALSAVACSVPADQYDGARRGVRTEHEPLELPFDRNEATLLVLHLALERPHLLALQPPLLRARLDLLLEVFPPPLFLDPLALQRLQLTLGHRDRLPKLLVSLRQRTSISLRRRLGRLATLTQPLHLLRRDADLAGPLLLPHLPRVPLRAQRVDELARVLCVLLGASLDVPSRLGGLAQLSRRER